MSKIENVAYATEVNESTLTLKKDIGIKTDSKISPKVEERGYTFCSK